eukprot:252831-Hanusia_phi.AAC.1
MERARKQEAEAEEKLESVLERMKGIQKASKGFLTESMERLGQLERSLASLQEDATRETRERMAGLEAEAAAKEEQLQRARQELAELAQ